MLNGQRILLGIFGVLFLVSTALGESQPDPIPVTLHYHSQNL